MEDDGTPMELVNHWLDPIRLVLVIDVPKVPDTLATLRPRIDALGILQICIGDSSDVNTSNVDPTTSTCPPISSIYNHPVDIPETLDTQLFVSNKLSITLKSRRAIVDGNVLFWPDILHWILRPLVTLFRKKTPPTPSSGVQSSQLSLGNLKRVVNLVNPTSGCFDLVRSDRSWPRRISVICWACRFGVASKFWMSRFRLRHGS